MKIKLNFAKVKNLQDNLQKRIKLNRKITVFSLGLLLLLLTLYTFKGQFVVALVNGRPIFRTTLISELEKQAGAKVLDSLITKSLVFEEAGKQKVSVSNDEVNQEIKKLEDNFNKQGQSLDQLLSAQGMTRKDLEEQIRLQKIVEKILVKEVTVTDGEIKDYFDKNKTSLYKTSKFEDVREEIKKQLEQEKLSEKIQTWLSSLRESAKINYFLKL